MDSDHKATLIGVIGVSAIIAIVTLALVWMNNYAFTQQLEMLSNNGDETGVHMLLSNFDSEVLIRDAVKD